MVGGISLIGQEISFGEYPWMGLGKQHFKGGFPSLNSTGRTFTGDFLGAKVLIIRIFRTVFTFFLGFYFTQRGGFLLKLTGFFT